MGLFSKFGITAEIVGSKKLPIGAIIMWDGLESDIPQGWYKCDGMNGTPNLVDRFILGALTDSEIGKTGGNKQVTLTSSTMPRHTHNITLYEAGGHNHIMDSRLASGAGSAYRIRTMAIDNPKVMQTSTTGNHNHDGSNIRLEHVGKSTPLPFNIVPSNYSLLYIMKAS